MRTFNQCCVYLCLLILTRSTYGDSSHVYYRGLCSETISNSFDFFLQTFVPETWSDENRSRCFATPQTDPVNSSILGDRRNKGWMMTRYSSFQLKAIPTNPRLFFFMRKKNKNVHLRTVVNRILTSAGSRAVLKETDLPLVPTCT